jgi:hypothetical protein
MNNEDFRAGVRAMFDYFHYRAANNYHPRCQEQCDKENAICLRWVNDALAEVSPEDLDEWKSIDEAYQHGFNAGKNSAKPK